MNLRQLSAVSREPKEQAATARALLLVQEYGSVDLREPTGVSREPKERLATTLGLSHFRLTAHGSRLTSTCTGLDTP
jgi:hypothetical protein